MTAPRRRHRLRTAALLLAGLLVASCGDGSSPKDAKADGGGRAGCVTDFSSDKDYFPVKSTVTHAENFTLRYEKSYQVLTVKQPYPNAGPESYILVKCGAPKPSLSGDLAKAPQLTVPVRSLYSMSTTHLPLLTATDRADVVTGVADASLVNSGEIRDRIKAGKTAEYAKGGTINTEKVIAAKPDVLVTQGSDDPRYPKLRSAGIPVVANAEWLEPTPLGRAEWVKAMAALTGAEQTAGQVFQDVENAYAQATARAARARKPVDVLSGSMFQGTWTMAAGGSYVGTLIKDAGGTYPWAGDRGTGSLRLGFEAVYAKAGGARLWLTDQPWKSGGDITKADSRYGRLAAVRDGEVWTNTRTAGGEGGNDFYERGVLRPDLILDDMTAILHPELAKGHTFVFYEKVPTR
ncbi:ABC transporter substrate-binding protein [Streptomyces sp. AV19]|uniref:ABC transporter substrate-binding protein n=1 Tax=Streptomyces sp. AV19 TaxID=2793068 RepID=UPI0018FF0F03|nr:ABC transporter substrate-binding protein [Streptomyces sp. AV19]MBH1938396.1 ABC transporter substrate-binding protein [Streptomyces sp. AV19]MDG4535045.1 ABC transporter substrate-binding protein [Streptomyces sp. AV19]